MKIEVIKSLTDSFESFSKQTEAGVEFWLVRDLQHLLGYEKWANFQAIVSNIKTVCENFGYRISDHFAGVGKMVKTPTIVTKINSRYGISDRFSGVGKTIMSESREFYNQIDITKIKVKPIKKL